MLLQIAATARKIDEHHIMMGVPTGLHTKMLMKIASKWIFIPLKFGTIGFDPLCKEKVSIGGHAPLQQLFLRATTEGGPQAAPSISVHIAAAMGAASQTLSQTFGQLSSHPMLGILFEPPPVQLGSSPIFNQPWSRVKVTNLRQKETKAPDSGGTPH